MTNKSKGQGLVEYAIVLVMVAVVVIVILALLGPVIGKLISSVIDSLSLGQSQAVLPPKCIMENAMICIR